MFPNIEGAHLVLVGGSVRDMMLKKKPKDQDYVVITELKFDELVDRINATPGAEVFQAKKEFLTIRCKVGSDIIDIAYPRKDHNYEDGRHPDGVEQVKTLKDDASRRDFTINAMYFDPRGGLIDFFNGSSDIKAKTIRCVGDPIKRFEEDHLRIIRAIRFSAQLGFIIEHGTFYGMVKVAPKLINTDFNRIRDEINKGLKYNARLTLRYIRELELFPILASLGLNFQLTSKEVPK